MMLKNNVWQKMLGIWLVVLFVITGLTLIGGSATAADDDTEAIETEFPDIEIKQETITGKLGGGDFVGIYNEDKDAMIGVLYGTTDNPNNVYLVSLYTRYIGTADVYEDGEMIKNDHPIPVFTLFAQRFAGIYEFNDANGDGMYDSRKVSENDTEIITQETVYKMVPTFTAWEPSELVEVKTDSDTKEWTFSLTSEDHRYKHPWGLWNKWNVWNERLEKLEITFHLYFTSEEKTADVPVWEVEVTSKGNGNYDVGKSTPIGTRTYKGQSLDASFKYDTLIDGWEYDPNNDNRSLLWVTQVLFANAVTDEVYDWFSENFLDDTNSQGEVEYETGSGTETLGVDDTAGEAQEFNDKADNIYTDQKPTLIRKNRLSCGDNWQNIGGLTWVNEVDVDGTTGDMYFQIYGALPFAFSIPEVGAAAGFIAQAGFTYPGGETIYHDPTYSSSVFQISEVPILGSSDSPSKLGALICCGVVFILIIFIVIVVIIISLVKISGRNRAKPRGRIDKDDDRQEDSDYYESYYMDKKR